MEVRIDSLGSLRRSNRRQSTDHVASDYEAPTISLSRLRLLPSAGGGFRRVLGAIAGGAANIVMPGIGAMIGGLVAGGAGSSQDLEERAMQYLELMRQMQAEHELLKLRCRCLKARHDSTMSAIRTAGVAMAYCPDRLSSLVVTLRSSTEAPNGLECDSII